MATSPTHPHQEPPLHYWQALVCMMCDQTLAESKPRDDPYAIWLTREQLLEAMRTHHQQVVQDGGIGHIVGRLETRVFLDPSARGGAEEGAQ